MKRVGKKRRKSKSQGIITVFVTLMMVPVVAITGIMVDVARLKLYSSQAVMAADSYGDAVLSEFDNLLKELYGLFSVTQNEKGLAAIEKLAEYTSYSFHPDEDEKGFTGFMPYQDAKLEVTYEKLEGASLSNNSVLMTQISDFMKYRIVEEVMEEGGILSSLEQFDSLASDTEAMEERSEITDSSAKALGKIEEYYKELKKLDGYPSYLENRENAFVNYSKKMTEIVESDEYDDYVYYLEHKSEIEAIIKEFEKDNGDKDSDDEDDEDDEDLAHKVELYDRFSNFDADEYVKGLKESLSGYSEDAKKNDSDPIDFKNVDSVIDKLGKKSKELDSVLTTLKEQVGKLKGTLADCSTEVRQGIEEEIAQLEDIIEIADDFKETYELIAVVHDCKQLNKDNKEFMETEAPKLDVAAENIFTGNVEPGNSYWAHTAALVWYDFKDDKSTFYSQLEKLCDTGGGDGDKKAGKKEIKKANKAQEDAEKKLKGDEQTTARDISPAIASQLKANGASTGKVPDLKDYFAGGLSFDSLARAGSNVLDKFLVTTYDFGMFTSRVSGIKPKEDGNSYEPDSGNTGETYVDYSLTGIEMSPDVNYLCGAELEYLFGGHNKSVSNLNETRNIICGVRLTMNFASTYMIKEVNNAINTIANEAAAAVAASGVGAPAAPLVRVAVSGALRAAVAAIETAADWDSLKERESVILIKKELGDLKSAEALANLLNIDIPKGSTGKKLKLSYEDYLYILLCLLVDDNTLLSRTSNLITLNMNQAMNSGDTLANLDFKMSDTVTAVKAVCKVKADFVVLPDNIAALYYSKTSTESLIEVLEGNYFGYSVIRGY